MNATTGIEKKTPPATLKTSVSLPRSLHTQAVKRANSMRYPFSTYVQTLIDADLKRARSSAKEAA